MDIHSIEKALEYAGATVQVTDEPAVVAKAQAVVLPGVGSGGAAMARMTERGLDDAIRLATQQGKPFLGICLGMQLLADHHAEGEVDGLGLFRGEVRRIPHGPKIPHMGWNQVMPLHPDLPIFQQGVAAVTDYGSPFCSVIATEQVWGTQFHPEKSGMIGLQLLKNFVRWANG